MPVTVVGWLEKMLKNTCYYSWVTWKIHVTKYDWITGKIQVAVVGNPINNGYCSWVTWVG